MSELLEEMTREERTRNTLECDTESLTRVADALYAAAAMAATLAQNNPHIDALLVLENCLWQVAERIEEPLGSLRKLAGQYSNERTIEEAAAAIYARYSTAH